MELPARVGTIDIDVKLLERLLQFPQNVRIVSASGAIRLLVENLEFDEVQPGEPTPRYTAEVFNCWRWKKIKEENSGGEG